MPVIVASKPGKCSACMGAIVAGELIGYTRKDGARHLECVREPVGPRPNPKDGVCRKCSEPVEAWTGTIEYSERRRVDGAYSRRWRILCRLHSRAGR
jgi:hypothetical protein